MRVLALSWTVVLWTCLLSGCEVAYTEPATQPAPRTAAEEDFEAVWQASRQTLRSYHFELDRQDRRDGILTTGPMTGMHFFEFWRQDAARPADFAESTFQTVYRTARVTVQPVKGRPGTYHAQVEVFLRRSDRGPANVTSTSDAYSLVNPRRGPRRRGGQPGEPGADQIVELGNDRGLEAKLTAAIAAAADRLRGIAPPEKPEPAATQPAATQPAGKGAAR